MSVIILEGLDKVGKSTLARKLQCEGYQLIKVNAPKTANPFQEYVGVIAKLSWKKNYVFDRFYLGELAYGEVYRGKSKLTTLQQFYLENLLLRYNPTLVYCWLDYNELTWNFVKDKEEITRQRDIPRLDKLFRLGFKRSLLPKQLYNYNKQSSIVKPRFFEFNLGFAYLGRPSPEVLFVGDEPNYRLHLVKHVPYQVFNSTSGMYLVDCLKKLSVMWGVVNSKEGHWLLGPRDVEKINPQKIVCLGNNSMRRISKLGLRLSQVDHPQFAKRFYGENSKELYVAELRKATR